MVRKYLSSPPFFFLIPFRKFLIHIKQFPTYIQVAFFSVILGNDTSSFLFGPVLIPATFT